MASSSHAYLQPFSFIQHAVKSSRMDVVELFWGRNCSPCARVTGHWNHFEFIPTVSVESQHSTGGPTCHDFPRFVIISEKSIMEVGNRWRKSPTFWGFWGKRPLRGNFHKWFPKRHMRTRKHVFLCKFREICPTGSRWNRPLFNGKTQNFGSRSRCRFCAVRAQYFSVTAPNNMLGIPQISSTSVHFRRSYNRTREHRSNAPQSVSYTRRSFSFFAE